MSLPSHQAMLANKLLAALPRAEFDRLALHLEQVNLSKDTILYDAGEVVRHAYFLQSGMISLLSVTDKEDVIEVGAVGYEGMVGIPSVLPNKKAALGERKKAGEIKPLFYPPASR
ncbi:MAG: cyclic nucleotide-binding domain-containing protein [Acidobacteriota bacterium]|nr:cyclic nucleotide-binding domain-containing protein [Acidobacteriota bacterium]